MIITETCTEDSRKRKKKKENKKKNAKRKPHSANDVTEGTKGNHKKEKRKSVLSFEVIACKPSQNSGEKAIGAFFVPHVYCFFNGK